MGEVRVPARKSEIRKMFPRQEYPYLDSDRIATPYPNSLRSANWRGSIAFQGISVVNDLAYLVSADLELGYVPGSVLVRRPLNMSELRFICRSVTANIKGQFNCARKISVSSQGK